MALGPRSSQVVHGRPFEVLTPKVHQTFARLGVESFVGTEEGPVLSPQEATLTLTWTLPPKSPKKEILVT